MKKTFIFCVVLAVAVLFVSCGGGGGGAGGAAYIPPSTNNETVAQQTETQVNAEQQGPKYINFDCAFSLHIEHSQFHDYNHIFFYDYGVYGQMLMTSSDSPSFYQLGGNFRVRHFTNGHVIDVVCHTNENYTVEFSLNFDNDYRLLTITDYYETEGPCTHDGRTLVEDPPTL